MVTSKISRVGDLLAFEVNGKPAIPYGYMSYQPTCADYAGFRKAGVRLYFTGVYAGDRGINTYSGLRPFRPGFWKARDVFDFSAADEDFRLIAGGSPREGTVPEGLFIIPRLMLEPPSWWEDENPDALARDFEGKSMHQSYSSEKWFADTIGAMEAFQAWLVESGWDAHVAGWHLACGATEEFMRPTIHPLQYTDYSGASKLAWREYVRELFGGTGSSLLTASVLLGMMILPTIITVAESALNAVPAAYYEGALALGATHECSVFHVILPAAKSGVMAGIILGIGRAVGEATAVMMVAGNRTSMPKGLLKGVRTLTSNIVIEMGYATDLHREALIATAVVLFVFILLINVLTSILKRRDVR